jgi:site-specific recombinase XerD
MPYASEAQKRWFHWAAKNGKIDPKVVEEYDRESEGKKLPERLGVRDPKRLVKYTKDDGEKKAGVLFKLGFLNTLKKHIK